MIDKLAFVPQLFFGRTFEIGKQPYQDMKELIGLRNELVHYKMGFKQPNSFKDLQQRKIALTEEGNTWTYDVSSLEGMLWAHNTLCDTIQKLTSFATENTHPIVAQLAGHGYYSSWSEAFIKMKVQEVLAAHGK